VLITLGLSSVGDWGDDMEDLGEVKLMVVGAGSDGREMG